MNRRIGSLKIKKALGNIHKLVLSNRYKKSIKSFRFVEQSKKIENRNYYEFPKINSNSLVNFWQSEFIDPTKINDTLINDFCLPTKNDNYFAACDLMLGPNVDIESQMQNLLNIHTRGLPQLVRLKHWCHCLRHWQSCCMTS